MCIQVRELKTETKWACIQAETWKQRALNWQTGETVAVKQIGLSNIPANELPEIMVSSRSRFSHTICLNVVTTV